MFFAHHLWHVCRIKICVELSFSCNPPTRFGVHSLLFLCSIQNFVTRCPSKIPSPKSKIPKIQNPKSPKSKIQNPQNPKSPNSKIQTLHIKICYIMFQKSKIPNPQNPENPKSPKSKIPKIQNPQNPKSTQSKIQNPQNPKNPKSPKSKIPNPKSPKSKIQGFLAGFCGFWGFWILGILDFGFGIPAPKSKIQTPQNPKSPKSKIPKIQNPQNPQNPKSSAKIQNLGRWGPHVKNCYITIQNPKSKIPKIRPKKFGFWILGILDFGILGFWILGILGFWGFWILGILGIWDFGVLGRSRGCTTRQFGDGAWRSEARIPPGLPLRATSKPTVSNRVGARKQIEHFFRGQNPTKSQKNPDFQPRGQNFTKSQKNLDFQPTSKQI